jgi:hypothetical protein
MTMSDFKEELKALKQRHRDRISAVRGRVKGQTKDLSAIKTALKEGRSEGMTVPEIAAAADLPSDKVLWYVTALRKYGQVVEGDQDGGYFRYLLDAATQSTENVEAE